MASCNNENTTSRTDSSSVTTDTTMKMAVSSALKPAGPAPEWGKTIHPEMQAVIEKLVSFGDKPTETLSATAARKNHTPTDAVMDLVKENNVVVPSPTVDTAGKEIAVNGGNLHLRIYTPKASKGPLPVIVYYHGGGFVIANIDVYNASAQGLAEQVDAIVVSVAYRLAPENKFPVAHNDSFAAYEWVVKNAGSIKGDPKRIAVVGESAGGNLAAVASILQAKNILITLQVLFYPVTNADTTTASYQQFGETLSLTASDMAWFFSQYAPSSQWTDPAISPLCADLPPATPPAWIALAAYDVLYSEGQAYADRLQKIDKLVGVTTYEDLTHGFVRWFNLVDSARAAIDDAAREIQKLTAR